MVTWRAIADQWAILTYCDDEPPRQPARRTQVAQHPKSLVKITRHPRARIGERRSATPPPLPRRQAARQATAVAVRRACVRATTIRKPSPGYSRITVLTSNTVI